MERRITQWLNRYGNTFFDRDFGYSDCDMIDSCLHDLSLDDRALVSRLVDSFIAAN
jgi:hypothetical protein